MISDVPKRIAGDKQRKALNRRGEIVEKAGKKQGDKKQEVWRGEREVGLCQKELKKRRKPWKDLEMQNSKIGRAHV